MSCHCARAGLGDVFGERTARLDARRFRRHGLARRADRLIEGIRRAVPFHDALSLEGGAGVGGLSIELLRRGVQRAVAIDAVPAAVRMARSLAEQCGVAGRLDARIGDFTELDDDESFDIVVLDRVVCCYPDWRALLEAAATHARAVIGFTYPRDAWWTRAAVGLTNGGLRAMRKRFRLHVHPPEQMHTLLRASGFLPDVTGHEGAWELCVARRTGLG